MARTSWLCILSLTPILATLNCGSLFGTDMPTPPATAAFLVPTVSFESGFDCSAGGQNPLTVTWSVSPVQLQPTAGNTGLTSGFSATENLTNVGGTTTECDFTPSATISDATSAMGLEPGIWQITLSHTLFGYPNPLVCTGTLALGDNSITFAFGSQGAACQ